MRPRLFILIFVGCFQDAGVAATNWWKCSAQNTWAFRIQRVYWTLSNLVMSLGWLSEPAVLPSESKPIPLDPSSVMYCRFAHWFVQGFTWLISLHHNIQTRPLAEAVFKKEQEARQYGAIISNRQSISTLRNQQKKFIENQNAARRDEFVRQQTEKQNRERMQQKIKKYDSIMRGDSNSVSNQYLFSKPL